MPVIFETFDTSLANDRAFAFVADFATSSQWDPGVAWSEAVDDGPPKVGSRYRLGVRLGGRVAPMEYRITELEPGRRVVLEGTGSNVVAVDDIRFLPTESGTRVEYRADIRLTGWMRLIQPFTGRAIAAIGRNGREGMKGKLDRMAAEGDAA